MTTLLMTGTIAPPAGARQLAVRDVGVRLAAYRSALAFNRRLLDRGAIGRLVFVENSGHGMDEMEDLVAGDPRVALLSYDGSGDGVGATRFFGECSLLRHAFRYIDGLRDDSRGPVFKVTGRYVVRNLAALLARVGGRYDVALHCRNYPTRYVDFGLAGFRASRALDVLDRILARPGIENEDERVLRRMLDEGAFDGLRVLQRLPRVPDFVGVRGKDGASYGGLRYRAKYALRAVTQRVAPAIWI